MIPHVYAKHVPPEPEHEPQQPVTVSQEREAGHVPPVCCAFATKLTEQVCAVIMGITRMASMTLSILEYCVYLTCEVGTWQRDGRFLLVSDGLTKGSWPGKFPIAAEGWSYMGWRSASASTSVPHSQWRDIQTVKVGGLHCVVCSGKPSRVQMSPRVVQVQARFRGKLRQKSRSQTERLRSGPRGQEARTAWQGNRGGTGAHLPWFCERTRPTFLQRARDTVFGIR